jgi:hypothetical protein
MALSCWHNLSKKSLVKIRVEHCIKVILQPGKKDERRYLFDQRNRNPFIFTLPQALHV